MTEPVRWFADDAFEMTSATSEQAGFGTVPLADYVTLRLEGPAAAGDSVLGSSSEEVARVRIGPVTIESSGTLEWDWESSIQGGLRFQHSRAPAVFLAGYGIQGAFRSEYVVEGFYKFAGRWFRPEDLACVSLVHRPFPVLLGWQLRSGVTVGYDSAATDVPGVLPDEPSVRHWWTGWTAEGGAELVSIPPLSSEADVRDVLVSLFQEVHDEEYEFGEEAEFDNRLGAILGAAGDPGLDALIELLMESEVPSKSAAARSVYVVARSESVGSKDERLRFLISLLGHRQASMRDAAALGLYDLGSPGAIVPLREAMERERSVFVRKNVSQLLAALERRSS